MEFSAPAAPLTLELFSTIRDGVEGPSNGMAGLLIHYADSEAAGPSVWGSSIVRLT